MRDRWDVRGKGEEKSWGFKGKKRSGEVCRESRKWKFKKGLKRRWKNGKNDRFGANTRRSRKSMRQPEKDRWWEERKKEREAEKKRERERDRARELHAIRITSSIPQFGYVIFVAQLIGVRSMHILNFNTKEACELIRRQNNQYNSAINCWLASKQHAWVTCKQQLIIVTETKACF